VFAALTWPVKIQDPAGRAMDCFEERFAPPRAVTSRAVGQAGLAGGHRGDRCGSRYEERAQGFS
jgi:hypothetical protein